MAVELVSDGGGDGTRMATPGKDLISRKSKYKVVYKKKQKNKNVCPPGPLELRHLRGVLSPRCALRGAIPSLPLELRSLCKGAWHRYASGGAVPLLPHEMRRCEIKM